MNRTCHFLIFKIFESQRGHKYQGNRQKEKFAMKNKRKYKKVDEKKRQTYVLKTEYYEIIN